MKLTDLTSFNAERAARRSVALVTDLVSGSQRVVTQASLATDPLATEVAERLRLGRSGLLQHGDATLFLTVRTPIVRLVVVGAVRIAEALVPMARLVELELIVVEPRPAFANLEPFAGVRLIAEEPADALCRVGIDASTAIALLTHDPAVDDPVLIAALRADCLYIGALGSRKTHAARLERMRAEGFEADDLARIHAPIGLDIGAVTPAEIAVAIIGEVIAARRRKPLRVETTG